VVCGGCDDRFLGELARRLRIDLPAATAHLSDDVFRPRVALAVNRAIARGAASSRAISRFVLLMFALEPEFDRRHRILELRDLWSLETDGHPNCWYRADRETVDAQWSALCDLHRCVSASDDGERAALPPQLSQHYGIQLDAPYVGTPHDAVRKMLELARVGPADVVLDLGCGDGRIVIAAAAEYGARGVGIDLREDNVLDARNAAARAGVADRVTFRRADFLDVDPSIATVVTLYLLRHVNLMLRDRLRSRLPAGARIVSRHFDMGDWQADAMIGEAKDRIYCWRV
jgi:SAM-dependent methyltransferase